MRYLILSGGGWKGAFQLPICLAVEQGKLGEFDHIAGTSVGSINGVLTATGKMESVGKSLWNSIDDRNAINGIKGFMRPTLIGNSLFTLEPIRELLEEHISLKDLKVSFGAGVVVRQTHQHLILQSSHMQHDRDLHDAVEASAAIAFLMKPVIKDIPGTVQAVLSDGGHRHVFPILENIKPGDEVVAVSCNPITQVDKTYKEVDGRFESIGWLLDMLHSQGHDRDIEQLHKLAMNNIKVTLYAPRDTFGGLLKADKKTIAARRAEGLWALDNPIYM